MTYIPDPIDTSSVELDPEINALTEKLARNAHEVWSRQRFSEGWTYGPARDDKQKQHPGLIAYEDLSETEKQYDRNTAMETLKVILALGYEIKR